MLESVRTEQQKAQRAELIGMAKSVAEGRGKPFSEGTVTGHRYERRNLFVSVYSQTVQGERGLNQWEFVVVTIADREVFVAGALTQSPHLVPQELKPDFTIQTYRRGPWESRLRNLIKPKPQVAHQLPRVRLSRRS